MLNNGIQLDYILSKFKILKIDPALFEHSFPIIQVYSNSCVSINSTFVIIPEAHSEHS